MRYLVILPFLLNHFVLLAQDIPSKLFGKYHDNFGNTIVIKTDSTFNYYWRFDLTESWSKGVWRIKNDTLYFKTILRYDTLRYKNNDGKLIDSLVLNNDENPKSINSVNIQEMLSSNRQNRIKSPNKLFYKNEKLFELTKQGKLIKKRIKGFWTKKKWKPWYFKQLISR